MKKLVILSLLTLSACDPGGVDANFECIARDAKSGYCIEAKYSCPVHGYPSATMLTYSRYYSPRCQ